MSLGEPLAQERRAGERRAADRRRPGRPSLVEGQESVFIYARVPVPLYDKLCRHAKYHDASLPAIIRALLERGTTATGF